MLSPVQAIFKAIDVVKREDWVRHTAVFLYRGAWQVLFLPCGSRDWLSWCWEWWEQPCA